MVKKQIIISSSGLKNVILSKYQEEDDFIFVFGEEKFQMKSIYAEFISPVVSHLHQTDPTINTIDFGKIKGIRQDIFKKFSKSLITSDTISLLHQISSGSSIEINEDQSMKLRLLSFLLGNDELPRKLNEAFPPNYSEENVNYYMKNIECLYRFSEVNETIDFSTALSFIASHFYMVDEEEFLKLSREIQYMIISHEELQIESEDSLFDIVSQIIEMRETDEEEIEDILFLEQIEFVGLSESKFKEFISVFDFNFMSGQLWQNLCQCFFGHPAKECKRKLKKRVCSLQSIIVCGLDHCFDVTPNNEDEDEDGKSFIDPPVEMKLPFDYSSILSYSAYGGHSVIVMNDGSLKGIGNNLEGQICGTFQKTYFDHFTDFSIIDGDGNQLDVVSAVCSMCGTLYMFSNRSVNRRQLFLCDLFINEGQPVFLDIGNHQPVALFGGSHNYAAIGSEGEIIFIDHGKVVNSPDSEIEAVSLPDGEKASSVVCCLSSVVVLSKNGRVFCSPIDKETSVTNFAPVSELSGHEIVCVSGTHNHCLAVSNDGRVFGRGLNLSGELGLDEEIESVSSFTEISSLSKYKVRAAYAGNYFSLFETREGEIISYGSNSYGQCFSSSCLNDYDCEDTITSEVSFCIAGNCISAVFIGSPPPNTPNMQI